MNKLASKKILNSVYFYFQQEQRPCSKLRLALLKRGSTTTLYRKNAHCGFSEMLESSPQADIPDQSLPAEEWAKAVPWLSTLAFVNLKPRGEQCPHFGETECESHSLKKKTRSSLLKATSVSATQENVKIKENKLPALPGNQTIILARDSLNYVLGPMR